MIQSKIDLPHSEKQKKMDLRDLSIPLFQEGLGVQEHKREATKGKSLVQWEQNTGRIKLISLIPEQLQWPIANWEDPASV